jgi:hypothetical protein
MILIYPYLQKLHLIALLNFHTHAFQCFIHTSVEYRTSVFRRKYQMVYQHRNIMTFVDIFAHIDILRRKRRGIQPEENKLPRRKQRGIRTTSADGLHGAYNNHFLAVSHNP